MKGRTWRDLTLAEILAAVTYDPLTGEFRWACTQCKRVAGERAERKAAKGYLGITINGVSVLCHRLARFIVTGAWPAADVDHRNGVRADNRLRNLRDTSRSVNMQNLRQAHCDTASGRLGVYFDPRRGKWYSTIRDGGRQRFLGYQASPDLASEAYITAKRRLHEGCTL